MSSWQTTTTTKSETLNYNFMIVEMIKWLFDYKVQFSFLFIYLFPSSSSAIICYDGLYTMPCNLKCIAARLMKDIISLFFALSSAHTSARVCHLWFCVLVLSLWKCIEKAVNDKLESNRNTTIQSSQFSSHDNNKYNLHVWWFWALCAFFSLALNTHTSTCSSVFRL